MNLRLLSSLILLVALASVTACGSEYLRSDATYADEPGFAIDEEADIRDTLENRQVLDVLLQYRKAMVAKDFGTLNRLVSADYYENSGTTDTTRDDYGSEELAELYELMANHADKIKYDVLVKEVEIDGRFARVDYEYEYAYQYKVGDKLTWDAGIEVNRLELENDHGDWKIISGL